jgi:hypothetical protein
MPKSKEGNRPPLRDIISYVLIPVLAAVAYFLYDVQGRLGRLEGRVDVLSGLIETKVVTQTITVTYITTGASLPTPPVPGYPFESIVMGLFLGLLVVLLIHRSRRYW